MRIALLTQSYPPVIGGIEQHVRNLGQELTARGHYVVVVTLWQDGMAPFEYDGEVRVHRVRGTVHRAARLLFRNPQRWYAPPFPDPELVSNLRRVMGRERPDIVHAHNWLVHSYLPLKRRDGPPLVVTLHDYGLRCPKWVLMYQDAPCSGPRLTKCLRCTADHYGRIKSVPTVLAARVAGATERRKTDLFVPVSQAVAEGNALEQSGVAHRVIYNFMPESAMASSEDDPALAPYLAQLPQCEYILYVGAFGRYKGFHALLDAYGRLVQSRGPAAVPPLVLIGYETSEFPLDSTPLPEGALALRHWPHAAVMQAWRRSMLGVVPSIWPDPCPTVAMEAMSMARPVVASRIGGLPDIVAHDETGLLVPPDDPAALHEALARLLDDEPMRLRMGQAGRARFGLFSAAGVIPLIERAYTDVLAGARRTAG